MRADVERVQHEKHNSIHIISDSAVSLILEYVLVVLMNEIITKEMLTGGYVPEIIFDKLEDYKTAIEWMETFKFQVKKAMEENGVKKWSTDYFTFDYINETESAKVDTKRMKETNIFVMDALSGELEEVNAYEFFTKKSVVKAHVTYKEKK